MVPPLPALALDDDQSGALEHADVLHHRASVDASRRSARTDRRSSAARPSADPGFLAAVSPPVPWMVFKPLDAKNTMVQISESGWREDDKGLVSSYGNCGGWMHMIACLKAYLEYGINLRSGGAV
jgi:uncharacterized protein YndB with AHSA1/START domain